ncbi:hypothetical protein [Streptomyces albidoflavus]|uniref:hypothetical protein n=1 Tax=Streptomyces albidoflavus TaxID=1886 RepID=UPI00332B21B8
MTATMPEFIAAERPREHPGVDGAAGAPSAPGADPAAPYGRKADGTPKAKPGRPAGTPNREPRAAARPRMAPAPGPTPAPTAKKAGKKAAAGPDYRSGVLGLFQVITMPLVVAGAKNDALLADAAAVSMHGPVIADALAGLAAERPEVAAVLDRVMSAGPYGALIAAVVPLAVQIAANHKAVPGAVGSALGAQDPADLVGMMRAQAPQAAAA